MQRSAATHDGGRHEHDLPCTTFPSVLDCAEACMMSVLRLLPWFEAMRYTFRLDGLAPSVGMCAAVHDGGQCRPAQFCFVC